MNSNNDLMPTHWTPTESTAFEKAYGDWYNHFKGEHPPSTVHVRLFCEEYIKKLEARIAKLREGFEFLHKFKGCALSSPEYPHVMLSAFARIKLTEDDKESTVSER